MTTIDLIIALQNLPPNMEVMVMHTGAEMFRFSSIVSIEEVTMDNGQQVVAVEAFNSFPEIEQN